MSETTANTPTASSQTSDPILEEIWRIKEEIAAEHGFDVRKLAEALRLKEKQHPERVVNLSKPAAEPGSHER